MTRPSRIYLSAVLVLALTSFGCEQRIDVKTYARHVAHKDKVDRDALPTETRALYDALFDGNLLGLQAAEFQPLLETAQRITDKDRVTWYEFQLTGFDRPYEEVFEEGVPFLLVKVQKKFGHIYMCDVCVPEY